MTDIYGECPSCVEGKNSTASHGQPSTSPPPTSAGGLLHADLVTLKDGTTVKLLLKDDHSGHVLPIKILLGKTKTSLADVTTTPQGGVSYLMLTLTPKKPSSHLVDYYRTEV